MALTFSSTLRTDRANAVATTVSTSAKIRIYDGGVPANVAGALNSGTTNNVLVEFPCSASSFGAAQAGSGALVLTGLPLTVNAALTGTASFFRVLTSGNTAHIQGTVTATGGGGDMTLNSVSISANAQVQLTGFTLTEGNA